MLVRSLWCPSALRLRVVVSSACLLCSLWLGRACGLKQSTSPFLVLPATSLPLGRPGFYSGLQRNTSLSSEVKKSNVEWGSVRTKALFLWMCGCVDRSSPTSSNRSGFGTCVQEVLIFLCLRPLLKTSLDLVRQSIIKVMGLLKLVFLLASSDFIPICAELHFNWPSPTLPVVSEWSGHQHFILLRLLCLHTWVASEWRKHQRFTTDRQTIVSSFRLWFNSGEALNFRTTIWKDWTQLGIGWSNHR